MSREARHALRTVISIIHIIIQVVLFLFVVELGAEARLGSKATEIAQLNSLVGYLAMMIAVYAIQYSAMKLLEKSHNVHQS